MRLRTLMILIGLACLIGGCAGLRSARDGQKGAPQDTDVYRVVCFYPPNMWKSFDPEGDLNPEGFSFVMYLISRKTNKGILTDGNFYVEIYKRGEVNESGRRPRLLMFQTNAPMSVLPRRAPTLLGAGYQPIVYWGDDLNLLGEAIEIVIKYESPTGRTVASETVNVKVPDRKV